jgi:hypothetical protein
MCFFRAACDLVPPLVTVRQFLLGIHRARQGSNQVAHNDNAYHSDHSQIHVAPPPPGGWRRPMPDLKSFRRYFIGHCCATEVVHSL